MNQEFELQRHFEEKDSVVTAARLRGQIVCMTKTPTVINLVHVAEREGTIHALFSSTSCKNLRRRSGGDKILQPNVAEYDAKRKHSANDPEMRR